MARKRKVSRKRPSANTSAPKTKWRMATLADLRRLPPLADEERRHMRESVALVELAFQRGLRPALLGQGQPPHPVELATPKRREKKLTPEIWAKLMADHGGKGLSHEQLRR